MNQPLHEFSVVYLYFSFVADLSKFRNNLDDSKGRKARNADGEEGTKDRLR